MRSIKDISNEKSNIEGVLNKNEMLWLRSLLSLHPNNCLNQIMATENIKKELNIELDKMTKVFLYFWIYNSEFI